MTELTYQQMFDKSYLGVMRQGGPSALPEGPCQYRGPAGRRCAIGHLIPDKRYTPSLESKSISGLDLASLALPDLAVMFLSKLQSAHDAAYDVARNNDTRFLTEFHINMRRIADAYHLTVPAVTL